VIQQLSAAGFQLSGLIFKVAPLTPRLDLPSLNSGGS
jgi:hypothetical protein